MLRRMLFLLALAVVTGCSDPVEVTEILPRSSSAPEKTKPVEVAPTGGVNKCAIYRTPEFCGLQ
jgi:hypothetical protein